MPQITKIATPAKSPRKRSVHLDGRWAFNCLANVVEKFSLAVGLELSEAEIEKIKGAEVQQKAIDKALNILSRRLHSRSELKTKLLKAKYSEEQVEKTLEDLTRMGYIDDARFAKTKAHAAAEYKKHGRRRAYVELMKAGVDKEVARKANEDVYDAHDSLKVARELAAKKAPALRKLDPIIGRRRLAGMLLRRGFTYDEVRPVIDDVLGPESNAVDVVPTTGEVVDPAAETTTPPEEAHEPQGNWRDSLLSHHSRRNEKPAKSKWGWNRGKKKGDKQ